MGHNQWVVIRPVHNRGSQGYAQECVVWPTTTKSWRFTKELTYLTQDLAIESLNPGPWSHCLGKNYAFLTKVERLISDLHGWDTKLCKIFILLNSLLFVCRCYFSQTEREFREMLNMNIPCLQISESDTGWWSMSHRDAIKTSKITDWSDWLIAGH